MTAPKMSAAQHEVLTFAVAVGGQLHRYELVQNVHRANQSVVACLRRGWLVGNVPDTDWPGIVQVSAAGLGALAAMYNPLDLALDPAAVAYPTAVLEDERRYPKPQTVSNIVNLRQGGEQLTVGNAGIRVFMRGSTGPIGTDDGLMLTAGEADSLSMALSAARVAAKTHISARRLATRAERRAAEALDGKA